MARRRNSVAKRFSKIRGLPPEEKALMQRIGNLMDAALNNRQASNPFEKSTIRQNRQVYPPTGLLAQSGIASVKLIWDPANSNEHLRYEIEFLNLTTGESITKSSFTNNIVFRGANGAYQAKVSSIGRDGSKSTVKQVEFNIGKDVMLIEGAKNDSTELGTIVQDNITLYKGFSVYTWGSVVLDKQTLDTNNQIVFRLWRAETPDALFSDAVLQETIILYAATESGSSLDTTARAGLISRPVAVRPGAFETSQSLMFSPLQVADVDDEKVVTYFLQAINRETELDEVALSLTMWAGMDGVGSAVPGDVFVPKTPYVFPNLNSFHNQLPGDPLIFPHDRRSAHAMINDGFSLIGNEWTVAFWIRFDDLDANNMSRINSDDPNNSGNMGTKILLSRGTINTDNNSTFNSWRFSVGASNLGGGNFQHKISLRVNWFDNEVGRADSVVTDYIATTNGDRQQFSDLFPYGDAIEASNSGFNTRNNGWMFMVICFTGGDFTDDQHPKTRLYMNIKQDEVGVPLIPPEMALAIPTEPDGSNAPCVQTDVGRLGYQFGEPSASFNTGKYFDNFYTGDLNQSPTNNMAYNQIGIWNVALDTTSNIKGIKDIGGNIGPIRELYNGGKGTEIDWKQPSGGLTGVFALQNYSQHENLIHLIQFGAVEKGFHSLETLRDTGYFLPGGDLNFTQDVRENEYFENWHQTDHTVHDGEDRFHQREVPINSQNWFANLGQTWNRGTDIGDILSPTGSNNTTQYNWAHPGQNL